LDAVRGKHQQLQQYHLYKTDVTSSQEETTAEEAEVAVMSDMAALHLDESSDESSEDDEEQDV
jgi:hypothetical protein